MPSRERAPSSALAGSIFMTSDTERARAFYGQLFGWTAEAPAEEFGGYFTFTKTALPWPAALPSRPGSPVTDVWSVYLASDDARQDRRGGRRERGPGRRGADGRGRARDDGCSLRAPTGRRSGRCGSPVSSTGSACSESRHARLVRAAHAGLRLGRQLLPRRVPLGHPRRERTRPSSVTPPSAKARASWPASWTRRIPARGGPAHWSGLLRGGGHRATLAKATELGGSILLPAESTPYRRLATAGTRTAPGSSWRGLP